MNNGEFEFPSKINNTLTLRDVLKDVPKVLVLNIQNQKKSFRLSSSWGYWRDLPEEIAKDYMGKVII